jgi:predicted phage tail protein
LGTLTGTAALSVGGWAGAAITAIGIAFSVGVSLLITALTMPSAPGSSDATGKAAMMASGGSTSTIDAAAKSYVFDNLQNNASQGSPIPIGYGRMKIGSEVINVSSKSYSLDQLFDNEVTPKNIPISIYD